MSILFLRACEPAGEETNTGDQDPCLSGCDGALEVLRSSAPSAGSEDALDHPWARQNFEAFDIVWTIDVQRKLADLWPAVAFSRGYHKCVVDRSQRALVATAVKVFLHRRERQKIRRKKPPCATRGGRVYNRVHQLAHARPAQSADPVQHRHKRRNPCLLLIRQVTCVARATTLILREGDFRLGCRGLRRISITSLSPFGSPTLIGNRKDPR